MTKVIERVRCLISSIGELYSVTKGSIYSVGDSNSLYYCIKDNSGDIVWVNKCEFSEVPSGSFDICFKVGAESIHFMNYEFKSRDFDPVEFEFVRGKSIKVSYMKEFRGMLIDNVVYNEVFSDIYDYYEYKRDGIIYKIPNVVFLIKDCSGTSNFEYESRKYGFQGY